MGVNRLWNILEPVRKEKKLSELRNKTLCVDLSCWICEAQCANGLKQNVSKPHLRNLFFRLVHLTRVGVKLVFVVDGDPPKLKWEAIVKRIQSRNGETGKTDSRSASRVRRSHFANWVEEVSFNTSKSCTIPYLIVCNYVYSLLTLVLFIVIAVLNVESH